MNKFCIPKLEDIQTVREKLGISQNELAQESGVPQSSLSRVESTDNPLDPRYSTVILIFEALNRIMDRREREAAKKIADKEKERQRNLKRDRDARYRESQKNKTMTTASAEAPQ